MLATFASITGATLPDDAGPDSFDILPVLQGRQSSQDPVRRSLVVAALDGTMSVRMGPWKLITALGSHGFSEPRRLAPVAGGPTGQLYNLADDLGETNNLYLERPDIVAKIEAELARIQNANRSRP
jgi:hypothetical protein